MPDPETTPRWLPLCAMALLAAAAAGVAAPSPTRNLARNRSFEADENKDGLPDGWEPIELCTPYRTTRCERNTAAASHGSCSAMIRQGSLYLTITGTAGWVQRRIVEQGGGKTFRVSVQVRAAKPKKNSPYVKAVFPTRVRLYLFGEDPKTGNDYTGAASPIFEVGPEWQKVSHTNTFPAHIAAVSLILAREAQNGGGDVWFDRVEVVEVRPE